MNTHEAYTRIKRYFSKPGARLAQSRDELGRVMSCEYLASDGAKCAVGCLIPKALYDSHIEGLGAGEALIELRDHDLKLYEATFGDCDIAFLEEAQQAHDEASDVGQFLRQLEQTAGYYSALEPPEPAFTGGEESVSDERLAWEDHSLDVEQLQRCEIKTPDGKLQCGRPADHAGPHVHVAANGTTAWVTWDNADGWCCSKCGACDSAE